MSFQQLSGKQIRPGVIEDKHIHGQLTEAVLNINWSDPNHAKSILKNKVITDYVQFANAITVSNASEVECILSLDTSADVNPGVIVGGSLRFRKKDGDIITHEGKEVKATIAEKVGPDVGGFKYKIKFFESDGLTPFTIPDTVEIEFLYPVKTTLWDAVENFASNERYVDGAIDIISKMKIEQLVADVFGPSYSYTGDGSASLGETIVDQIVRLTRGTTHTGEQAPAIIDEVVTARGGKTSVNERLQEIEAAVEFVNDHTHGKAYKKLVGEQTAFVFGTDFTSISTDTLKVTDDLDVYVNGQLQEETLNYTITKDSTQAFVNGFSFSEPLVSDDVVSLRWTMYR